MQSVKQNLLAAFRYLLKPIIRLALGNGVSALELGEVVAEAFVDVAARELKRSAAGVTDEGVALITGMDAATIRAILNAGPRHHLSVSAKEPPGLLPTILEKWHTDPDFIGPYGVARDLPFVRQAKGGALGFTDLVTRYCPPSASPRVLLDELLRGECVQDMGSDFFRPLKRFFVPAPLSTESILRFSRVVHNICETLARNLSAKNKSNVLVERIIYADHPVSKEDFTAFDQFLKNRVVGFANEIDDFLSDRENANLKKGVKTGVGIYHYVVNEEDEQALSDELIH
jgi:Family of unknown function (DUF6502)